MKKITLSILALSLVLTAIQAQEKTNEAGKKEAKEYRHHPGKHRKQHHADFKKLNLSQEQQDKLININKDYRAGVADLKKQEATTTVKDYKAQMQTLNKKRRSEVDNVFTKEQKDQLQQMRTERKRKFDTADKGRTEKMKSA
jgi:Spy/CpxP family protein refolding chaperone